MSSGECASVPAFVFPSTLSMSTRNSHTLRQIVTVYNPYEFDLEYKVLSTAPALYSVQESVGRLKPQSLVDIVIRRNSPDEDSADISCVDKFRVQVRKVTKPLLIGHSDIVVFVNGTAAGTAAAAAIEGGRQTLIDPTEEVSKVGSSSRRDTTAHRRSPTRVRSDQRSESFHWLLVVVGAVCILCLWTPYAEERMDAIPSWYPEWLRLTVPQKLVSAYVLDNHMSEDINLLDDDPYLETDPLRRRLFCALELCLKCVHQVTESGTAMVPYSTVSSVRIAVNELYTSLIDLFRSRRREYYNAISRVANVQNQRAEQLLKSYAFFKKTFINNSRMKSHLPVAKHCIYGNKEPFKKMFLRKAKKSECSGSSWMEQTDTVKKREDYLSWNDYFMSVAVLSSQRSKDPQLQEGACLVNKENQVVGIGYNGMPVGCNDDEMPWADKADDVLETKHPYICHAVLNAVMNKISAVVKECRLFSTHYPCSHCAGLIIQAGIKEVYYLYDNPDTVTSSATARLFRICNITCERYVPKVTSVTIELGAKEKNEEKET